MRASGRRRGQVERLHHEARDLAGARGAVVRGRGEHELVPRAGHGHVEEPPLLGQVGVAARRAAPRTSSAGSSDALGLSPHREAALRAPHQEHHRELEPLGLVHGEDVHGFLVGVGLGHGGVVTRLAQQVEVGHEGGDPVVLRHVAVGLDRLEEAGEVAGPGLRSRRRLPGQALEQPRLLQELVEHLAGAQARHVGRGLLDVAEEPRRRGTRLSADARQLLVRRAGRAAPPGAAGSCAGRSG